jgi:hypothetical protein
MRTSKMCIKNDEHPKPLTLDIVVSFGDRGPMPSWEDGYSFLGQAKINQEEMSGELWRHLNSLRQGNDVNL